MRTCLIAVLLCATIVLSANDVWAQVPQGRGNIFARIDTNNDGAIGPAELQAALLTRGQHAFTRADKNGDGLLTREEAKAIPVLSRQGSDKLFNALDRNKDGLLNWTELSQVYVRLAHRLFRRADKNNDGVLQPAEFRAVGGQLGQRRRLAT